MSIYKAKTLTRLLIAFLLFSTTTSLFAQNQIAVQSSSFSSATGLPHVTVQLLLPGQEISKNAADGLGVYFSNAFTNAIGNEDSYKLTNPDENIGIARDGKLLSIEGRKLVTVADTLPLKMWKLYQKKYTLQINAANLSNRVDAYLRDAYLNSNTPLENNAETMVTFNINDEAASFAPDRFTIFFGTYATLPVELTNLKAYEKNKGIEIAWTAENESNIDRYEIEQSVNAQAFVTAGVVKAKNNPGISASYSWFNANEIKGNLYYRIKSYEKSGEVKYSSVVKVSTTSVLSGISVSTKAARTNTIDVAFKNSSKGNYHLRLINYSGQCVYNGSISHDGGSANQTININHVIPAGLYQMMVFHEDKRENFPLLIR